MIANSIQSSLERSLRAGRRARLVTHPCLRLPYCSRSPDSKGIQHVVENNPWGLAY